MTISKESHLFRHAQHLIDQLPEWQANEAYVTASEDLVSALRRSGFQAAVFDDPNFPIYALMAYEKERITENEFSSMLLYWSAKKDYDDFPSENTKIQKFQTYELTPDNTAAKTIFSDYLTIESDSAVVNGLTSKEIDQIIANLQSDDIPKSERTFIEIESDSIQDIFERFSEINFKLFMPIRTDTGYRLIIPSFSIIQATVNQLKPDEIDAVTLVPTIGDYSAKDVQDFHVNNQHPFGLSFPGVEQTEADGFQSGRLGFSIHDIYHLILLMHIPNRQIINYIVTLGNPLLEQFDENDALEQEAISSCIESLIDAELREFLSQRNKTQENTKLPFDSVLTPSKPELSFIQLMMHLMLPVAVGASQVEIGLSEIPGNLDEIFSDHDQTEALRQSLIEQIPDNAAKAEFLKEFDQIAAAAKPGSVQNLTDVFSDQLAQGQERARKLIHAFTQFIVTDLVNQHPYWKKELGIDLNEILDQMHNADNAFENFLSLIDMVIETERKQQEKDPFAKLFGNKEAITQVTLSKKGLELLRDAFLHCINSANGNDNDENAFNEGGRAFLAEYTLRRQQLFEHCKKGDMESLAELLQNNPTLNVNQCDAEHKSPLHWATEFGHVEVVARLLQHPGAKVNFNLAPVVIKEKRKGMIQRGTTPLHVAASTQQIDVMKVLLEHGADASALNAEKQTAMMICLENGCVDGLRLLLKHTSLSKNEIKALRSEGKVHAACEPLLQEYQAFKKNYKRVLEHGSVEDLEQFLSSDRSFSLNTLLDDYSELPLACARNLDVFERLLKEEEINIDLTNTKNETALHHALRVLSSTSSSENFLAKAATPAFKNNVEQLIKRGANLQLKDKEEKTPIDLMIKTDPELAMQCLDRVETIDSEDWGTYSPIFAVMGKIRQQQGKWEPIDIALFKKIVEKGCLLNKEIYVKSNELPLPLFRTPPRRTTVWSYCRSLPIHKPRGLFDFFSAPEVIGVAEIPVELRKFCVEHGADSNIRDEKGRTELHLSAKQDWNEQDWLGYLTYLIEEKKVDVNARDNDGNTPLHSAMRGHNYALVRLLLKYGASQELKNRKGQTALEFAVEPEPVPEHVANHNDDNAACADGEAPARTDTADSEHRAGFRFG